jgi:hypothetical protein
LFAGLATKCSEADEADSSKGTGEEKFLIHQ